jgi:hypothetical protein
MSVRTQVAVPVEAAATASCRVVPDYPYGSTFSGEINWITIETGDDDSHLTTPEQQMIFHLAQH